MDDFPELVELQRLGLGEIHAQAVKLTSAGLERSDASGPWLYSNSVPVLKEFELV